MACSFQGAKLIFLLGNNKNRLIKNALKFNNKKTDDPISPPVGACISGPDFIPWKN